MTKPSMMMMMNELKMNTVPGWAVTGSVLFCFFINMDFLQHTVAIQTHSYQWLMFLLPSLEGRKIEVSLAAAVGSTQSAQEQWPVVTWPAWRCAGWEGRRCCVEWWWLTGNTLTLTRGGGGGVFIASNMFCQGCFVATGSHCLCTDTLPSLQDFTFFSAPLLCPRVCTWKVSYLWKTCTFVSPFLYFPYILWQWSLNTSSVWSLCLCVRLRTQTPERSERGVSRQSAIESNDASVSAIAPLGNQLAGFSPGLK